MALKIAAIADIHYAAGSLELCGSRRTAISDTLLLKAVRRLNRFIKPDMVLLLGDLIDDESGPQAPQDHQRIEEIIDLLECPAVVILGDNSEQRVSLSPSGKDQHTDTPKLCAAFDKNSSMLSIGGRSYAVPALCESPFAFLEIDIDSDKVETHRHELMLPRDLNLVDYHVHTPFAYCQENMNMPLSIALGKEMGLGGMCLTEHTGQLYFDRDTFWSAAFMEDGLNTASGHQVRMQDYLAQAKQFSSQAYLAFEIDCDYSGNPVVRPEDLAQVQVRVGAIHWLAELRKPEPDIEGAGEELLCRLSKFLPTGLHILAHPFRLFRKFDTDVPAKITPRLVDLLRKHNVAAEINFHNQETYPEFVTACVESGVKLVFGSDSHNLYEVGEFYPHLELMRRCGYSFADLLHILADVSLYAALTHA